MCLTNIGRGEGGWESEFLCGDRFDRGSRQVKREPVDQATEDYDKSLCQQIIQY